MKLQINLGIGTVLKRAVPKFWTYMLPTQLMVDSYSTLGHMGDGNSCEGDTLFRVSTKHAG
jgi:hypothetical protein